MNLVALIGRLVKDPTIAYTTDQKAVGKYTLAVDRNNSDADFINCTTFGKNAEFAEKYLSKGMKIAVQGSIKTGSFTNKDGKKVYTTDVIVDRHEFCESKSSPKPDIKPEVNDDEFVNIPEGLEDELPFV